MGIKRELGDYKTIGNREARFWEIAVLQLSIYNRYEGSV